MVEPQSVGTDHLIQEGLVLLARASAVERTSPQEAVALVERALEKAGTSRAAKPLRAQLLLQKARALFFTRELTAASEAANAAEAIFEELGDIDGAVRVKALRGAVFSALGHDEAALEQLEEGARLALRKGVSLAAHVRVLAQRASALRDAGHLEQAIPAHEQALVLARELGEPAPLGSLLLNYGATAIRRIDLDLARRTLAEARAIIEAHALDGLRGWLDALEGAHALARGDFAEARARAAEGMKAGGDGDARVNSSRTWAQAISRDPAASPEDRTRAKENLVGLVGEARERSWVGDLPGICRDLADLCEGSGDFESAVRWQKEAWSARDEAERSRRQQRLEAERLRLEIARLAIESEQHRVRSEMLTEANARLGAVSEERARLLAMLAHDLRSPLTAVGMCIEEQQRTPVEGPAGTTLKIIALATERMTTLIDETLSTESIRRGRVLPRTHPIDVVDLARRCVAGLSPLAERKRIAVELRAPETLPLETDAPALSRIVENLLTNALKFTPPGKRVRMTVRRDRPWVVLEFEDDGPGFQSEGLESLFELGRTGPARPTAGEVSTGIGLSVVHDLVAALGGTVHLGNREGAGAQVTIRLPDGAS